MSKTLLVADDSTTMRRVVEMTFGGEDLRVVGVPSAEAALAKAREIHPDVVLADAVMAGMSGYELCRAIKSDSSLRATPVIVMASQHAPFDEALGRDVGADDHCVKPFETQVLIDKVRSAAAQASQPRIVVSAPQIAPPSHQRIATPSQPVPRPAIAAAPAPASAAAGSPVDVLSQKPTTRTLPMISSAPPASSAPMVAPAAPLSVAPPATKVSVPEPAPTAMPQHTRPDMPAGGAVDRAAVTALSKAQALGLSPEQAAAMVQLTRELIERVAWEVVPDLAETIIREEIGRLTR